MALNESAATSIIMFSTTWCGDCRRSKRWLDQNQVPFKTIDIEEDPIAANYVMSVNNGMRRVPTILFPDGSTLAEPSNAELALRVQQVLGITTLDAVRALAQS